jgi:hypothetical protein
VVVPSGVDVDHFIPALRMPGTPIVLFLSAIERAADVQAAAAFCRATVPATRRRHPGTRFAIAGRNLPPSARDLARVHGVEVHAQVADIRPLPAPGLAGSGAVRAGGEPAHRDPGSHVCGPARRDRGRHRRRSGRPAGADLLVAPAAEACGEPIAELLGNPTLRAEMGGRAAAFVRARFAWDVSTRGWWSWWKRRRRSSPRPAPADAPRGRIAPDPCAFSCSPTASRIPRTPGTRCAAYRSRGISPRAHELTLGFVIDAAAIGRVSRQLRESVPISSGVGSGSPRRWPAGRRRWRSGGPSASRTSIPRLARRVRRRLRGGGYDAIYVSSSPMAEYVRGAGVPVVMDFVGRGLRQMVAVTRRPSAPRAPGRTGWKAGGCEPSRRRRCAGGIIAAFSRPPRRKRCCEASRPGPGRRSFPTASSSTATRRGGRAHGDLHGGDGLSAQRRRGGVLLRRDLSRGAPRGDRGSLSSSWA